MSIEWLLYLVGLVFALGVSVCYVISKLREHKKRIDVLSKYSHGQGLNIKTLNNRCTFLELCVEELRNQKVFDILKSDVNSDIDFDSVAIEVKLDEVIKGG